jgi:hypothetical protein
MGALSGDDSLDRPDLAENLPPRHPHFVGRGAELAALRAGPTGTVRDAGVDVVYGLGGVGKSALVAEHAWAQRDDYTVMWWLNASGPAELNAGLAQLTTHLNPFFAELAPDAAATWALGLLQAHPGWLLVLDDVQDPNLVASIIANHAHAGHLILTTRENVSAVCAWSKLVGGTVTSLDGLEPQAAVELLTNATGHRRRDDAAAAARVAALLHHVPIALEQAADYIRRERISPAAYLALLQGDRAQVSAALGVDEPRGGLARAWDRTLTTLVDESPAALRMLFTLADRSPGPVSRDEVTPQDGPEVIEAWNALGLLSAHGLIELDEQTAQIHPLVRAVLLAGRPPQMTNEAARE